VAEQTLIGIIKAFITKYLFAPKVTNIEAGLTTTTFFSVIQSSLSLQWTWAPREDRSHSAGGQGRFATEQVCLL